MITDENLNELFNRLRETEAQTREQQVRLTSLSEKIEDQNARLAGFSDVVDKLIGEIQQRETRSDNREKNFWKIVYVMLGTIVTLALGPKMAKEIIQAHLNGSVPVAMSISPIAPMHDHRYMWRV